VTGSTAILDLLINAPSLVMAEIAWYIHCILLVTLCFAGCLAVTIGLAGIFLPRPQHRRSHIRTNPTLSGRTARTRQRLLRARVI
jgi:hypothetical protein